MAVTCRLTAAAVCRQVKPAARLEAAGRQLRLAAVRPRVGLAAALAAARRLVVLMV